MKKFLIVLVAFMLLGCQQSQGYVEDSLKKLHTVPYQFMVETKGITTQKDQYVFQCLDQLEAEFKDDFETEALQNHLYILTFFQLNDPVIDNHMKVEIRSIDLEETGKNQYSYTIHLMVNEEDDETSGSIRFNDKKQISYWEIVKYPDYALLDIG